MRSFNIDACLVFLLFAVLFLGSFKYVYARELNNKRNLTVKVMRIGDGLSRELAESNQDTLNVLKGSRRGRGGLQNRKKNEGFMQKILPFMVIPFMISSMMIPMALMGLKFMLLKSALIGKIGIILLLINMFTRFNNKGGVYSHNINLSLPEKQMAMAHYGYNGDEEYGAYVHRRKRRRRR